MRTTIYIPVNRYHWLRRKVSKDWLVVAQTIYNGVSTYLAKSPMPNYEEIWQNLNMGPRHTTIQLPDEVTNFFTELGQGDFRQGFFIAIEVYCFSVDPDGTMRDWDIHRSFREVIDETYS